jgi:hypothetical protein
MMWLIAALSVLVGYVQGMLDPTQKISWSQPFCNGWVQRGSKGDSVLFTHENGRSEEVAIPIVQYTLSLLQAPPCVEDDMGNVLHELLQNCGLVFFLKLQHIERMARFDPTTFNYNSELSLLQEKCEKKKISQQVYKLELKALEKQKGIQQGLEDYAMQDPFGPTVTERWQSFVGKKCRLTNNYLKAWQEGDREKIVGAAHELNMH